MQLEPGPVHHGAGYWGVNTRDANVGYAGLGEPWRRAQTLIEMRATAARAADPVSVSEDRTLIISLVPGIGQYVANWIQRDVQWWIRMSKTREDGSEVTHDEFLHRVLAIEDAVAELP